MAFFKTIRKLFSEKPSKGDSPKKDTQKESNHSKKKTPSYKKRTSDNTQTSDHKKRPHHKKNRHHQKQERHNNKPSNRHPRHTTASSHSQPKKPSGKSFLDFDLDPKLKEKLASLSFTHSTTVQEKAIPLALEGKDVVCSSETGSGKTLAFLLPMIHQFYLNDLDQALVLCPTREIAIQIHKQLLAFNEPEILSAALIIGGTNMGVQKKELANYPKIIIATPGRLLDILQSGLIWLQYTGYVVLDEADRMLDMGFEEDLVKIHKELTGKHQTLFFSATLLPEIKKMINRYTDNYEEITIGKPTTVAKSVDHILVELSESEKEDALLYFARQSRLKSIVFFNTINGTSNMTKVLQKKRIRGVNCIHSKLIQSARERIIQQFKDNTISTLLASDVAARGIDVPNVDMVINFDVPNNKEDYIHRVGRTGRGGHTGIAITFLSKKLESELGNALKVVVISAVYEGIARKKHIKMETMPFVKRALK